MATKITTSTIRIAISHNYSTFEISGTIENEDGLTTEDIENTRQNIQALANTAVSDYQKILKPDYDKEKERIKGMAAKLKEISGDSQPKELKDNVTAEEAEKIASQPLFEATKETKKVNTKSKRT